MLGGSDDLSKKNIRIKSIGLVEKFVEIYKNRSKRYMNKLTKEKYQIKI